MKKKFPGFVPLSFLVLAAIIILSGLRPKAVHEAFDYDRFARLPVLDGGRFKPLDSLARTNLLILRGKQTVITADGEKLPARQWLTQVMLDPESAEDYPVFRIDHGDLQAMLGVTDNSKKYFSYRELQPHLSTIDTQARLADEDAKKRDAFQKAIVSLQNHLVQYQLLMTSVRPQIQSGTVTGLYDHYLHLLKSSAGKISNNAAPSGSDPELQELLKLTRELSQMSFERSVRFVPMAGADGTWMTLSEGLFATFKAGDLPDTVKFYGDLADAFAAGDFVEANSLIGKLEAAYEPYGGDIKNKRVQYEYLFNQVQPFILCIELYILIILATVIGWMMLSKRTLTAAFWILFVAVVIHTLGMVVRMWLMGRPPVTNLYSSAVYVGWGAAGLGLLLEWIYRNGIGSIIAAVTGFLSLIVAQHLMAMGDTMEMMRAVLDSNFWLTTHVLTVTMGYASTFVAGFLAISYVILGVFTSRLTKETARSINRMVYGIVCFSLFFSFVGTFLGGIWADQSWGRFWGWDPKENGALMIVIWNALIIHARRGGVVREKGIMLLAIGGNMVTAWSWFGTNMLGAGLHSYGFMESALFWLFAFWISQILLMVLGGFLPEKSWKSFPTRA
jgi:ABC-type transport system involved in cytochrome c biogenesis permease subunit